MIDKAESIPPLQMIRQRSARRRDLRGFDVIEDYASPIDMGDENPGYSSPDDPTGYESP